MHKLLVQSGKFKGMVIHTPPAIKGNENFTPSLVKKSVFSILDSLFLQHKLDKSLTMFVDLFSGSGQMGVEAISRGIERVCLFEISKERFSCLLKLASELEGNIEVMLRDSFRYHSKLDIPEGFSLVYFIDLPYSFWQTNKDKIRKLVEDVLAANETHKKVLLIQTNLDPHWENFEAKKYGNNILLYYSQV
jgi:16S rRNA (guanine966-N2)-methyltransferase